MLDVSDLRSFYDSPLGEMARRLIGRIIRQRWETCRGYQVLGLGYGAPYLERFYNEAQRTLAFMPAEMGVINWPPIGLSSSALVEATMLPVSDGVIDRLLLVHALETAEHPHELLSECWRILAPGGRLMCITPSRRGLWARGDGTPFGQGQPFSRSQLKSLLREALFSPLFWSEALYVPPTNFAFLLRSAIVFERLGAKLGLPFAGVHIVEATKQVYRPVGLSRALSRNLSRAQVLRPSLVPANPIPTNYDSPS